MPSQGFFFSRLKTGFRDYWKTGQSLLSGDDDNHLVTARLDRAIRELRSQNRQLLRRGRNTIC